MEQTPVPASVWFVVFLQLPYKLHGRPTQVPAGNMYDRNMRMLCTYYVRLTHSYLISCYVVLFSH